MGALAKIWKWLIAFWITPKTQTVNERAPAASIACPYCKMDYTDALRFIPSTTSQATLVCSNTACQEQMELYPDVRWGWLVPHVVARARIFR